MAFWPGVEDLGVYLHQDLSDRVTQAQEAIDNAVGIVVDGASGQLLEAGQRTETVVTHGDWLLILRQRPVTAVTAVVVDGQALVSTEWEIADADAGTIRRIAGTFGYRDSKAAVTYNYGFSSIPRGLRKVVLALAAREFENPQGKVSQNDGNYTNISWRLFPGELSRTEQRIIDRLAPPPAGRMRGVRRDRLFG